MPDQPHTEGPTRVQPPNNCVTPDGRHVLDLDREDRACIHCGWTASPPHTGEARVQCEHGRVGDLCPICYPAGFPAPSGERRGLSEEDRARVEELRAAYEAGFEESSEGYNGEYVGRKHRGNWPHFLDDGFKEFLSTRAIPASTPEPEES